MKILKNGKFQKNENLKKKTKNENFKKIVEFQRISDNFKTFQTIFGQFLNALRVQFSSPCVSKIAQDMERKKVHCKTEINFPLASEGKARRRIGLHNQMAHKAGKGQIREDVTTGNRTREEQTRKTVHGEAD